MRRRFVLPLLALGVFACTDGLRGAPMNEPPATGKIVASATTAEPHGLRVLWNGRTSGADFTAKAWVAGDPEELDAVWSEAAFGREPVVDFREHVVFAFAGQGGVCSTRIVGIDAEASGLLTVRYDRSDAMRPCILVATRTARIIAVPRRILPATVVFIDGFAFAVPEVPFG